MDLRQRKVIRLSAFWQIHDPDPDPMGLALTYFGCGFPAGLVAVQHDHNLAEMPGEEVLLCL